MIEMLLSGFHPKEVESQYEALVNQGSQGFFFYQDSILVHKDTDSPMISLKNLSKSYFEKFPKYYLGKIKEQDIYAIELLEEKFEFLFSDTDSEYYTYFPIKSFLECERDGLSACIFRGKQLLNWHKTSLYCSVCGGKTKHSETEIAKICEKCQRTIYPTTATAVLVLIEKGDQILLARSHYFRPGVYSVLAGYVEAGETAEQTIVREIQEEVGISVKNIRYFGSQSWPFDNTFMLAFLAEYASGEIVINPDEIEDAQWFDLGQLPQLPFKSSLSRKLIDSYIEIPRY